MATNFDGKWKFIAEQCVERIKHNTTASIRSVIKFLQDERKIEKGKDPTDEDLLIVEGMVIADKRYKSDRYKDDFHVTRSYKNIIERHPTAERIGLLLLGTIISVIVNLITKK